MDPNQQQSNKNTKTQEQPQSPLSNKEIVQHISNFQPTTNTSQTIEIQNNQDKRQKDNNKDKEAEKGGQKKQKQKDKTITLTIKQMNKIRKQLQKMQTAKKQNEQLRNYIVALQKKIQDSRKTQTSKQALEQTIKHLQRMVDESSKSQQKAKRQQAKYRQIYKHEKQMLNSLKIQVEQLRRVSSQYFVLKQQVSRLNNQCVSLREARDQYPIIQRKCEQLQILNKRIKQQCQNKKKQLQAQKQLKQKLQAKLQSVIHTNKQLLKQKTKILCQKQELCGELQALSQQIQDQRTDQQVKQKKIANEIKQLKITLHQQHQKLKITEHQLEQCRKNAKQTIDLDKVKLSSLNKQDLFNLLEQSQMKIVSLKLALNDAGTQIHALTEQLKQKNTSILTLAREITKQYPNLDESQGMQYVQKDIIQMGKMKKDDWGQIVQKVMIQNLRLKSSVTALGQEYNLMMRLEKDKEKDKK